MRERILHGTAQMGLSLPDGAAETLAAYWQAVLDANRTLNLTRIVDEEDACCDHFLDSLAPLALHPDWFFDGAEVVDVGTGAGFPGVPLAAALPRCRFTLLDARRKKLAFIEGALHDLPIDNAAILHARAEEIGARFDIACARAVAALPRLCSLVLPMLKPGGRALLWKGPAADAEFAQATAICRAQNAKLSGPLFYELPGIMKDRRLYVAQRGR